MPFRTPPERRLREVHSPDRRHIRRAKCIRQRAATPGMVSPFLTLPLPLWPPEPKSPYLRSGKCLFRVRIQPDVKARFLDFKPATHRGGTFPTGTMPCPRKIARHLTQRQPGVLPRGAAIGFSWRLVPPTLTPLYLSPPSLPPAHVPPQAPPTPLP